VNQLASKLFAIGAIALLMGAFAPHSTARAQSLEACVDPALTTDAIPQDPALAVIRCSERVECTALECKDVAGITLLKCLKEADGEPGVVKRCDAVALAALANCQFTAARGDAACYFNPTGETTLPGSN
jgi:hypothetical protein